MNGVVAAIGLGSNLESAWGGPEDNLREAVRRVSKLGLVSAVSNFRETEPVGYVEQPRFLNGALLLETERPAPALMAGLLEIEAAMGRVRVVEKGPRVIDLDLLLFGDAVIVNEGLIIPHPGLERRRFVLGPLAEIAPGMVSPLSGLTIRAMLDALRIEAL